LLRFPTHVRALVCVLGLGVVALSACASASSETPPTRPGPETIFQAPGMLIADPAGTLREAKLLGIDRVRVFVSWASLAPNAASNTAPAGFNASDPAAYPAGSWAIYDTIARDAAAQAIGVDFTLTGPGPQWATTPGGPPGPPGIWKPSPSAFGAFVHAVATRYSGSYTPAGAPTTLPRVDFWAIWNEPNYGVELAPQATDHSTVEVSPALYRRLLNAAWAALQQTGHGGDTILIGELAPRGITVGDSPGNFSGMVPLRFLRALYCADGSYQLLRGAAAAARGCPTTSAGSAAFVRQNPALFHAGGFAVHPYPLGVPPNLAESDEPDYADLPAIPRLEHSLDTLQRAYGSSTRFPIYDTEFGYQTNPPERLYRAISPPLAAYYLNWAEYIHWQDPRIRSYDQYLLVDPGQNSSFDTGLEFSGGTPKATFYAFRMPLYLPVTTAGSGTALEIWGCVRPAPYARQQTGQVQQAQLQFQAAGRGPFRTIRTVTLTNAHGYFDVRQKLPGGGTLRVSWSYPRGPTVFSRGVVVTIH
jgi:hypothetical protein